MANIASGFALVLHGGAGTLRRGEMTAERETAYRAGLWRALRLGTTSSLLI
jgi:L-asparaginase / beta-aspartyl-peptidase